MTDTLFVTETELQMLTDETLPERAVGMLFEIGASTVVVKMGDRGIVAAQRNTWIHQPAVKAPSVKDRTGAGDVAAAGFLAGRLMSLGFKDCLHFAAICASKSIEGYGRNTYPDRALLEDYLTNRVLLPS
jgi:sugar/nucleoside kinase (ribokinase family)